MQFARLPSRKGEGWAQSVPQAMFPLQTVQQTTQVRVKTYGWFIKNLIMHSETLDAWFKMQICAFKTSRRINDNVSSLCADVPIIS